MTTQLKEMTTQVQDQIEQLVDLYGMSMLLGALANICAEKIGHLENNWQDRVSAANWRRAMNALDRVSCTKDIEDVS